MVCERCEIVVKAELKTLNIPYTDVKIGEADIAGELTDQDRNLLKLALYACGLSLLEDENSIQLQKIKSTIIDLIYSPDGPLQVNLSSFLSQKLNRNYNYLSNFFTSFSGTTIQHFYITHKIGRVKELLNNKEYSLTAIANLMHYSSVAHLSSQFKKTTGYTPSNFKYIEECVSTSKLPSTL